MCGFLLADFMFSEPRTPERNGMESAIPFKHSLHGDSIGLDCSHCHTGASIKKHAYMPSKADCMDCHRLPLTENPGIEKLDSALQNAPEQPWNHKADLPEHVVFHHGVHKAAGVECSDCHSTKVAKDVYGGESFSMDDCLSCHRGIIHSGKYKQAPTYCGACHR